MFLALFLFTMVEFAAIAKDTTQTSEYAVLEYDKHLHIIWVDKSLPSFFLWFWA